MNDFTKGIIYSLSYFTTLPIKVDKFDANKQFYKGVVYGLPISGFILSILTILFFIILPFAPLYKALLLSILYLFSYGFIHLEAVADTIDGYFASLSGKDVYFIMKEPQIGAIGAIGTFCFVLLKVLAISYLLYYEQYLFIVVSFVLSRVSLLFALDLEFHKNSSFINSLKSSFKVNAILKLFLFPIDLLTKWILKGIKKKFGFINGDSLGFVIEVIEILVLNVGVLVI